MSNNAQVYTIIQTTLRSRILKLLQAY